MTMAMLNGGKLRKAAFAVICSLLLSTAVLPLLTWIPDGIITGRWIAFTGIALVSMLSCSVWLLCSCTKTTFNEDSTLQISGYVNIWSALTSACGLLVLLTAGLQLAGVLPRCTGGNIAGFDNTAGLAAVAVSTAPFLVHWLSGNFRNGKTLSMFAILLYLVIIYVSGSRAGVVALTASTAFLMASHDCSGKKSKVITVSAMLMICLALLVLMSRHKLASTSGRMLILSVCLEMFRQAPLLGHGIHGFRESYMLYQADYLDRIADASTCMLADNIAHPLNEYALLTVNFGSLGLAVCIAFLVFVFAFGRTHRYDATNTGLAVITGLAVLSLFSYPSRYPISILSLIAAIMLVVVGKGFTVSACRKRLSAIVLFAAAIFMWSRFIPWSHGQIDWGRCLKDNQEELHHLSGRARAILNQDPYYLYSLAFDESGHGDYENALEAAERSFGLMANYDTALLIGHLAEKCGLTGKAETYWRLAARMCPSRFIPEYRLFCLYRDNGRAEDMESIGRHILDKPVKVQSPEVRKIRLQVRREMIFPIDKRLIMR